jgi:glycosyltransferase involved in cell wall biosynthesis
MENDQKIAIIIPAYNSAPYLNRLFSALKGQTYQNFKVVFVYDVSKDETLSLIYDLCKKNPLMECFILEKPFKEGAGKARDFALDRGVNNTEFTLFLDADDLPHPDFLEKLVKSINQENTDIAICGYQRVSSKDGHIIAKEMIHNPNKITDVAHSSFVPLINTSPWNKLFKTSVIEDARFIYPGGTGEDALFFCKVLPNVSSISFVDEVLYDYFVNPNSVTSKITEKELEITQQGYSETLLFFKSHGPKFIECLDLLEAFAFLRLGIGETTRACLDNRKAKSVIIKSTKNFLNSQFPNWRKNRYWSFSSCFKKGLKTLMIWRCRLLYKINLFGLFVFEYKSYTTLFKKDIKW